MTGFKGTNDLFGCEWAASVPWYWKNAVFIQKFWLVGSGFPLAIGMFLQFIAGFVAFEGAIATSIFFVIPLLVCEFPPVAALVLTLFFATREPVKAAHIISIDKYLALPDDIRKQLLPLAKKVDRDRTVANIQEWAGIIDGFTSVYADTIKTSEQTHIDNIADAAREQIKQLREEQARARNAAAEEQALIKQIQDEADANARTRAAALGITLPENFPN